jgi:hypothetical protein
MRKKIALALTLICCFGHSAHANINEWVGLYRGVAVVEQTDGKRHEIQCELQISETSITASPEMLQLAYSDEGVASIKIQNLSHAPKHLLVPLTDMALGIPPLFAHPISINLQKEPGGFNEMLITGDLVEYDVSYAQDPKIISTLHLKLGKLK